MLKATDEGSAPRTRRLGSMIAGRRKAGDEPSSTGTAKAAEPAPSGGRASRAASDDGGDDDRPRVRRGRRGGRGRRPAEGTPEAAERDERDEQGEPDEEKAAPARRPARAARPAARAPRAPRAAEPETPADEEHDEAAKATTAAPRTRTRTRTTSDGGDTSGVADEIRALRETVSNQDRVLTELREGIENLGERITFSGYRPRIAVFVDVPNLIYGYEGDGSLHMGKILRLLTDGRDLVRATAYSPVSDDPREPMEQQRFVAPFVPYEYRIVTKPLKRFADGSIKGNFDVEMAIDMVLMADRVDVMAIVSGDADFARAVEAVQQKGVRVEVVAFSGSTSLEMRALADHYMELGKVVDKIT